jgi:hypothetical protein
MRNTGLQIKIGITLKFDDFLILNLFHVAPQYLLHPIKVLMRDQISISIIPIVGI